MKLVNLSNGIMLINHRYELVIEQITDVVGWCHIRLYSKSIIRGEYCLSLGNLALILDVFNKAPSQTRNLLDSIACAG